MWSVVWVKMVVEFNGLLFSVVKILLDNIGRMKKSYKAGTTTGLVICSMSAIQGSVVI